MPVITSRVPTLMARGWATLTERSFIIRELDPDWSRSVEASRRGWVSVDCVVHCLLTAKAVGREQLGRATTLRPPTTPAMGTRAAYEAARRPQFRRCGRGRRGRDG